MRELSRSIPRTGCSNRLSARPQPMEAPEAYPQGYVEDAFEARTKLAACFSILLIQRRVEGHIRIMAIIIA